MLRIGEGYDSHALARPGPLMLGCVEVESPLGAVGHSDGDVVAHAVCDAIFGALAAGDIGSHFAPGDARWKDAASRTFLQHAARLVGERGGRLVNLDATVILERPRVAPYIATMRARLAEALGCDEAVVSVKAKSAEGMGPVGEGKAVEARAVVLIELVDS